MNLFREKWKKPEWLTPDKFFLLLVFCCGLGYWFFSMARRPTQAIALAPVKAEFFHDDFIEWTMKTNSATAAEAIRKQTLYTWVEQDGKPVVTVGGIEKVPFRHDAKTDEWRARWPCPWNAPDGTYELRVDTSALKLGELPILAKTFKIVSRPFKPIPAGWGVLTLESVGPLRNMTAPDGTKKDFTALADWADFIGADAIVIQGAESGGYDRKLPEEFPWITQSKKSIRALGEECHRRGLKLGVYVMCFLVGGPPERSPDYKYGWTYENGRLLNGLEKRTRRGVSITDPKRVKDIINVLLEWRDLPEVDFIGLDYIRPVFGGYELVDDFVREMPGVEPPKDWKTRDFKERMLWILTNRAAGADFIQKWYWYRAHRTAQIVRAIKAGVGDAKPIWAFNLSWDKGWHHGQDPPMMRDAGIDMDAIMTYEATSEQFKGFVKQWREYVKQKEVNLLVGDAIDWVLHQRTLRPAGPEDFYNRNMLSLTEFHTDGPVRGLFVHDYVRAVRGRVAPYTGREWMLAAGAAMTSLRRLHGRLSYDLALEGPKTIKAGEVSSARLVLGPRKPSKPLRVEVFSSSDLEVTPRELTLEGDTELPLRWSPNADADRRSDRAFLGIRVVRPDQPAERCQIHIMYLQGQRR